MLFMRGENEHDKNAMRQVQAPQDPQGRPSYREPALRAELLGDIQGRHLPPERQRGKGQCLPLRGVLVVD